MDNSFLKTASFEQEFEYLQRQDEEMQSLDQIIAKQLELEPEARKGLYKVELRRSQ